MHCNNLQELFASLSNALVLYARQHDVRRGGFSIAAKERTNRCAKLLYEIPFNANSLFIPKVPKSASVAQDATGIRYLELDMSNHEPSQS
jgi:hypothetical protein